METPRQSDGVRRAAGGAPASELASSVRSREEAPEGLSSVFDQVVALSGGTDKRASAWGAGRAWHAVNGDVERGATTGLYVAPPRRPGQDPVLVVYVDTRARATDFMANREIYLARLAHAGLRFSELIFRPTKRPLADGRPAAGAPVPAGSAPRSFSPDGTVPAPLPELTAADAARKEELVRALDGRSDRLRASAESAVALSMRRAKRDGLVD